MDRKREKLISIIMPTYNSEATIENALKSVRMQNINQSKIEILVIDGGSKDNTRQIARKYNATILENKKRLPEIAKSIGLAKSKGRYIIKMDSDEMFMRKDQINERLKVFEKYSDVKCIIPNTLETPPNCGFSCSYLNKIGDPFSFVVYHSKGYVLESFKRNIISESNGVAIFEFNKNDIIPIGDGGTTMIDMEYVLEHFENISEESFAATIFDDVVRKTGYTASIRGDRILHYSKASLLTYLKKLKFRVINNVYGAKQSGYSSRSLSNSRLNRRKCLYPLYCLSVVMPILDAFSLSIRFRDIRFLMHPFYCYYVLVQVLLYMFKKALGKKTENKSYA